METTEKVARKGAFKNVLLVLFGAAIIGTAYVSYNQTQENKVLKAELNQKVADTELAFKALEENLVNISNREGVVSALSKEELNALASVQDRISAEVEAINQLMIKNHKLIDDLTASVGEKDEKLNQYKKSIASLDKKIKDYKSRTEALTTQADALRTELESAKQASVSLAEALQSKTGELETKSKTIQEQTAELDRKETQINTAYYTVGTFRELKENNVVDKEGSFLGLAGKKSVKDDFTKDNFHKIDTRTYNSIPVFSQEAEIVTTHSSDSYEYVKGPEGDIQYIKILDPGKFWENNKYLVVLVEN